MFANPTAGGRIQAQAEPWDGTSIRVTRDCAGHRATNQGCALDLGDGRCDRPVLAVAAGTVTYRDTVQGILRIDHGGGWQSDYAHMNPLLVAVGATVTQGQQIGEIGDAHDPAVLNFSGCHLHFGILLNGVEQDPWPLLDQNIGGTDVAYDVKTYPTPRTWLTKGGVLVGRRFDPAPLTASGTFAAGSPALASAEYTFTPTPAGWPAGPHQLVLNGPLAGYLVANSDITLPDPVWPAPAPASAPPTSSGLTKADVEAVVKAAVAPLAAQIADLDQRLHRFEDIQ